MSTIAMWFDGGGSYGFGNVRRSRELGERLSSLGHTVSFHPLSKEAARLSGVAESPAPKATEIAILDLPYPGDYVLRTVRQTTAKVVALDYEGDVAPDLVISLQSLRQLPAGCREVHGLEYAIIRKEFVVTPLDRPPSNAVLVMVGGGDSSGLLDLIIERLSSFAPHIVAIQGPAGSAKSVERKGVELHINPPELPQLMARCAWGVTTGGTSMLEMICLGKAIHVIPRTAAEQVFAEKVAATGALLGLGLDSLEMPSVEQINRCSKTGPQIIDGRGCERIAELLETLP